MLPSHHYGSLGGGAGGIARRRYQAEAVQFCDDFRLGSLIASAP